LHIDLSIFEIGLQRFVLDCCRSDWNFNRSNAISGIVGTYDCIKAFSETDFTENLKKMDAPTLIIQEDADEIVHHEDAALLHARLVRNSTLKIIPGAPYELCTTHADEVNKLLLAFLQA
jgi:non-heme chloroperoxidase